MSDTNRVQISAKRETTPGTQETGAFDAVPFNASADLGLTPEYVQSTQIDATRAPGKNLIVGQSVSGGFEQDLQSETTGGTAGSYQWLQAAIGGADDVAANIGDEAFGATSALTCSGSSLNNAAGDLATTLGTPASGQMVYIYGSDVSGVDGVYPVQSLFSEALVLRGCPDFASNTTATVQVVTQATQGTEDVSFTLAKSYLDQTTPLYEYFSGLRVDTASISLGGGALASLSVGFMGESHEYTTASSHTVTALNSDGPISSAQLTGAAIQTVGSNNPVTFGAGGNGFITDVTVDIAANMRERNALGQLTPVGIGQGTVNVSGTLNCYFDNKDLAERVLDGTTQGLTLTFDCSQNVGDAGGSALGIYMPEVVFTQGAPEISGQNEDVMISLNFVAQAGNIGGEQRACQIGLGYTN